MDTTNPSPAPVVYPETDHMGEHQTQFQIAVRLVPLVVAWLALQGRRAQVSGNQFWYFVEGDPKRCRAPDVYVVDGVAPNSPDRASWKTWEGDRITFALEVASDDWKKDYDEAPADYDAAGAGELVIFDPGATTRSRKRVRWQVYRRVRGKGFVRVFAGGGDRVESKVLRCWVRLFDEDGNPRLRIATGRHGNELIPTDAERVEAEKREKARAEREKARAEQEKVHAEQEKVHAEQEKARAVARAKAERDEKLRALARARAAEAELARLRKKLRDR